MSNILYRFKLVFVL